MSHNITGSRRRRNGLFIQSLRGTLAGLEDVMLYKKLVDNEEIDEEFERNVHEFVSSAGALVKEIMKDGIE